MPRRYASGIRRSRRSSGVAKQGKRWFGALVSGAQAALTFNSVDLLAPADYQIGNLEPEGLLLTIYGHIVVTPVAAAGADVNSAIIGIGVWDSDIAVASPSQDPDVAANLTSERWLWTSRRAIGQTEGPPGYVFDVHIRQKARLKDASVRLVTSNSDAVQAYDYDADFRLLLNTR